jgi:DNA-binding transcriptional LysR family regulator
VSPAKRVEADNEAVIRSLVVAGLGVALMREDMALEAAAAGELCLWGDVRVETTLSFIHPRERTDDPVIHALVEVVRGIWSDVAPAPEPSTVAA